MYIAPGQGETTLGDNCFDGSKKVFLITGCRCKKIPFSDFMQIFHDFIHVDVYSYTYTYI